MKLLALPLIFLGELLVIYAEEFGAKLYASSANFSHTFAQTLIPLTIGAIFLVVGYMLGLR